MLPEINSEVTKGNLGLELVLRDLRMRVNNASMSMGVGNVYYVIKSSESHYGEFAERHQQTFPDGSVAVHADDGAGSGIISALADTVECRNDYVIVMPSNSDYDLTAALVMDKKSVHLIAPAGLSYGNGANNAVRLHQTGAYPMIELEDAAIEVAGFYLKNYATKGGVILNNNDTYGLNVHNNYFAMNLSGATNEPMLGPLIANTSGAAGAWGTFEKNFFQSQAGANATIAAIIRINSQATGARVQHNDIQIGDTNNTATRGILNNAIKGITNYNNLMAAQTASGVGIFTKGIQIHASGSAIENKGALATGDLVVGGTDEVSFVNNDDGTAGGRNGVEA